MHEEAAVREVNRFRKDGTVISDDAAVMLAALWSTGGSGAQRHLRALAESGKAPSGLAAVVRELRDEKAAEDDEMPEGEKAGLLAELDALTAWVESKESAQA